MFVAKKKKENKGSDLKSYLNQMRGNRRGAPRAPSLALKQPECERAHLLLGLLVQQVTEGQAQAKEDSSAARAFSRTACST
jgi:hypothetical protein